MAAKGISSRCSKPLLAHLICYLFRVLLGYVLKGKGNHWVGLFVCLHDNAGRVCNYAGTKRSDSHLTN